ncbi:MAG: alpha/beta fold hydrolase [Bariatricus sp.]|nr:alpha/beta fold hydrolase [Bariatricus sp.]
MKKKFSIIALITALTTITMHIINKLIYYIATIDNLLNNTEGNFYEWRFGKIFYKKQGEGTPILLIHDLNAHSSGCEWKRCSSSLSENHTVYTIDLLGCGRSDKPNITYTNYLYVQMLNDFIKHVINEKTDVIATGTSASFAVMACNTNEDLINRIVMVNPPSLSDLSKAPTKRTKILKWLIQIPILGTLLYNMLQAENYIEEIFQTDYFYNPELINSMSVKSYFESAHLDNSHSKYLFASIIGRYTNANILHCIKNITNSMYIIAGEGNPEQIEIADHYQKCVPAIETISIPETKYLPQLEKSEKFIEQINIFLI